MKRSQKSGMFASCLARKERWVLNYEAAPTSSDGAAGIEAASAHESSSSGSIAESVGKRAMEKDTSWKSPRAELFHCAWKSARATDFHFYHSPGDGKLSLRSDSGKK